MLQLPEIPRYIFTVGGIGPTWYGLMYVIGFMLGYQLAKYRAKSLPDWSAEQVSNLLTYVVFGVVLGGRCGYVLFYQFPLFVENPLYLFNIRQGGMSFHGGLLGVIFAMWLFAYRNDKSWLAVSDFAAPLFPIGLFFGRIGNFINAELWGKVTDMPWGVVFPYAGDLPRHPSQLYEALLEGLLLFVVILWYARKKPPTGHLSGMFLLGYGIVRFIVEFVRVPDIHIGYMAFGWLTRGQLLCLPMIIVGAALLLLARPRKPQPN